MCMKAQGTTSLPYGLMQSCMTRALESIYRNDPKFSDKLVWAIITDPDQTAPRGAVWSGSSLFAILSASFGCITLW